MTDMTPEVVPRSGKPDAAVATGSGHDTGGATCRPALLRRPAPAASAPCTTSRAAAPKVGRV